MPTMISKPVSFSNHTVSSSQNNGVKNTISSETNEGSDIFSMGLAVLYDFLTVLNNLAATDFKGMQARSKYARDVQDNANQVDEVIANAAKGDDKTKKSLPESVIQFMRNNDIKVDGMSIDDYLNKNGSMLDKGQLMAVKGALDNEKSSATDTMSQDQLQLQKVMQSYNVCANNISTLQSGLKDLLLTISRSFC
ncbi:Methyl-accepting chemotaxis protein [Yersinia massiliensis]|uniref:chemotaxis protein n=1 Tax=Yersinia massiliensis TaxID=419257 RepID=UPI0005E988D3|nr:chemotaxis protein [Yersinia massiliensis]CNH41171.1 Methyl-accepting chemotaxis protein [Yersinia massiliensis]